MHTAVARKQTITVVTWQSGQQVWKANNALDIGGQTLNLLGLSTIQTPLFVFHSVIVCYPRKKQISNTWAKHASSDFQ